MNSKGYKILMGWMAFFLIVIHFVLILIYAWPDQLSNNRLKEFSTAYADPVFRQKWSMFAPCPEINGTLEVKYYFDTDSTNWHSPTKDAQEKHRWYRGSYHSELVLAESNLIYWIGLDLDQMNIEIGDVFPLDSINEYHKGYSYFKVKSYLRGNSQYLHQRMANYARIRLNLKNVITNKTGQLELPLFQL